MVSQVADISLATIFYSGIVLIFACFLGCSIRDMYKKARRGDYYNNTTATTTTNTSNNNSNTTTNTGKKKVTDLTLQLCTINIYDEPLMGTIRTINSEDVETGTRNTTVADFGNQVILELDNRKENETICAICLNEYVSKDSVFRNDPQQCRHLFHTECILTWIQRNSPSPECPCCRSRIAVTKVMGNSSSSNNSNNNNVTKHTTMVDGDIEIPTTTASTRIPSAAAMEVWNTNQKSRWRAL